MVVEGHVQVAVAVEHHADDVVPVLHVTAILRAMQLPGFLVQFSLAQCEIAVAIVVADVLFAAVGHQRVVAKHSRVDRCAAVALPHRHQPSGMGSPRLQLVLFPLARKANCGAYHQHREQ